MSTITRDLSPVVPHIQPFQDGLTSVRSVIDLLDHQAEAHGAMPAHTSARPDGPTVTTTWHEYREQVTMAALGMRELGVRPGDRVVIMAGSRPEHLIADLAGAACAAPTASLYPTIADEQLRHILEETKPALLVLTETAQLARFEQLLPGGSQHRAVLLDEPTKPSASTLSWKDLMSRGSAASAEARESATRTRAQITREDVLTYIYTSGTSGQPKGVTLTHGNVLFQLDAWDRMGVFRSAYSNVCYLPLAHIAERLWSLYFPLRSAGHVFFSPTPADLLPSLRQHRPSFFMGVPRIWEKLSDAVQKTLREPKFADRAAEIARDRGVLESYWDHTQRDLPVPAQLRAERILALEGVLREIRGEIGMDSLVTPTCGAAPMSTGVKRFFASFGITIAEAYGLTETTGIATWERVDGGALGSAGLPLPGCEISLTEEGEILVKSPGVTPGYRNVDRLSDRAFVGEWFATGDIGRFDEAGRLYVIDRKKELIITSAGKNIAPTAIEAQVAQHGFIDQVMVIGDARPYLVCVMTVNETLLQEFAATHGLDPAAELREHPRVLAEIDRIVAVANERLSRPEQIKKFTVLREAWSTQSGELTPTLKLRRHVVQERYAAAVDALYADRDERTNNNTAG